MTRSEDDLREALRDLQQRADQQGAPSTASILAHATENQSRRPQGHAASHLSRWLPPLAAAAVVAVVAIVVTVANRGDGSSNPRNVQPVERAAGQPTTVTSTPPRVASAHPSSSHRPSATPKAAPAPAAVLDDAAAKLATAPWTAPDPDDFFYVRTTEATTWTSVSGRQQGDGHTTAGTKIWVSGCQGGQIVSTGESGPCTLNDVPRYLGDAPTTPAAWDAYLEQMAPGAKAADAQGKIIIQVLHQDLTAPKATAALLRYTASCPGLHTIAVRPVAGEQLTGVTCTSMTNGSYGLAFDATTHALVGFVGVTSGGQQSGPAEIVRKAGIVATIGATP